MLSLRGDVRRVRSGQFRPLPGGKTGACAEYRSVCRCQNVDQGSEFFLRLGRSDKKMRVVETQGGAAAQHAAHDLLPGRTLAEKSGEIRCGKRIYPALFRKCGNMSECCGRRLQQMGFACAGQSSQQKGVIRHGTAFQILKHAPDDGNGKLVLLPGEKVVETIFFPVRRRHVGRQRGQRVWSCAGRIFRRVFGFRDLSGSVMISDSEM